MKVFARPTTPPLTRTAVAWRKLYELWRRYLFALPPLALALLTLLVAWQYNPLQRPLTGDSGVFAYLAQLVADGFPPHKYAFNEQASLTFFIGGAFMRLGDGVGIHRLLALRAASVICFGGIVLLTYSLTLRWTRSMWAAFTAGIILVGMEGLGARAASALEPKALMLLFGLATLLALQNRRWFWAGVFGGLAGLVWQIAWGYLIVALLLALTQGGSSPRARARACLWTLAPALGVFGAYVLYFIARDASVEMVQQTFWAPALMHGARARSLLARALQQYNTFLIGYPSHLIFAALGVSGLSLWLGAHLRPWQIRRLPARGIYYFLRNRRVSGTLLVIAGFTLYAFLDFQNYPDWFPLLPFLALFAAWLLWQALARVLQFFKLAARPRALVLALATLFLLSVSVAHAFIAPPTDKRLPGLTWQTQERAAMLTSRALGPATPVWVIGKPELLFLMRRQNLNPYIYLFGHVDGMIDRLEPGGFQHMLDNALAQKPGLLVLARLPKRKFTSPANYRALENLKTDFVAVRQCRALGAGDFFARADLVQTLSAATQGCIKK